jgi:curli biogenesis system outer membrane secretion channel CsgG
MKRVIYLSIAVFSLLSCASLNVSPAVSVDRDEFFSRTWNVAVLDLYYEFEEEGRIGGTKYVGADKNGGKIIAGLLSTEFSNLENVKSVERGDITRVLEEQSLQTSGLIDEDSMIELGRLNGADAVVVGELTDYVYWENTGVTGTTISFSIKMISVETGKVLLSGSISRVRSLTDILPNAQLTVKELVGTFRGHRLQNSKDILYTFQA